MNMYNCMSGLAGITAITKQLHSEQLSLYQTVQDGCSSIYTQFHTVILTQSHNAALYVERPP